MSGPNLTASFGYDGEGRRVSKTINGITTNYIYDGLQVVEENQQSGPVTTQLSGGLDEVFWRKSTTGSTSQTEFLLTDALIQASKSPKSLPNLRQTRLVQPHKRRLDFVLRPPQCGRRPL